jgi:hypothetical protein
LHRSNRRLQAFGGTVELVSNGETLERFEPAEVQQAVELVSVSVTDVLQPFEVEVIESDNEDILRHFDLILRFLPSFNDRDRPGIAPDLFSVAHHFNQYNVTTARMFRCTQAAE